MKKKLSLLIAGFSFLVLLAACSSSSTPSQKPAYDKSVSTTNTSVAGEEAKPEGAAGGFSYQSSTDNGVSLSEKIIYTAEADIETMDFEKSVDGVYSMLQKLGGFVESSTVTGKDYNGTSLGRTNYRNATFKVRVPKENYSQATAVLSELGNVKRLSTYTNNITERYLDTESRLNTYRTEEERLLSMLGKAQTVEDMIKIEERLSNVRYQIESLTSSLKNWQNQVDYSYVNLTISEVKELTEGVSVQRSYWQEVSDAVKDTLKGIGSFFKWFFKFFLSALPVLLIVAVIVFVVIRIRLLLRRRKQGKPAEKPPEQENPKE